MIFAVVSASLCCSEVSAGTTLLTPGPGLEGGTGEWGAFLNVG